MGSPSDDAPERVELGKHASPADPPEEPFDPYRFGAPDVPPPPEYAPPGYTPPAGYQYPVAGENPNGPYPPYPYGTTAGSSGASPYGQPPQGQQPQGQQPYGRSPYGQPYGQGSYGQSPYGPGPQTGQGNGKAVAGLVLGIVSIVLFWTTIFDAIFIVLALIFGFLGLNDARARGGRGRGQALAGLICAGVAVVLAAVFLIFVVHLADKCGGISNQDDPGFQQCLRDHV